MYYVSLHLGDAAISQLREEKEFAEGQVNECVDVKHHACVLLFVPRYISSLFVLYSPISNV